MIDNTNIGSASTTSTTVADLPLAEQLRKLTELQHNMHAIATANTEELVVGYMVGTSFRPLLSKEHAANLDDEVTEAVLAYLAQRQIQVVTLLSGLGVTLSDAVLDELDGGE